MTPSLARELRGSTMKNLLIGIAVGFGFSVIFFGLMANPTTDLAPPEMAYSQFIADVDDGKIEEVTLQGSRIVGRFKTGHTFRTLAPHSLLLPALTDRLLAKKLTVRARPVEDDQSYVIQWIANLMIQGVFFGALWLFMARPLSALVRQLDASTRAAQRGAGTPPQGPT
ncbi:MAG TPA: ATP-dependent metallopeptidase FtsH/Yme1/Tma family protein [Xanthobacteraceae bacterium]|nr:ATP-dependent metallopeptidase FtsH/Yme1/Tma family protein [Xanthobacteraceae bacterium]